MASPNSTKWNVIGVGVLTAAFSALVIGSGNRIVDKQDQMQSSFVSHIQVPGHPVVVQRVDDVTTLMSAVQVKMDSLDSNINDMRSGVLADIRADLKILMTLNKFKER